MGQALLNPPSVEGWYTGHEWINSGSLLARINFVADHVADMEMPGVQDIVREMKDSGVSTPDQLLGACLDHLGYVELSEETQAQMEESIKAGGNLDWSNDSATAQRIGETMALIGATTEYQFG